MKNALLLLLILPLLYLPCQHWHKGFIGKVVNKFTHCYPPKQKKHRLAEYQ